MIPSLPQKQTMGQLVVGFAPMKRLVVISGSEATRRELIAQLEELFDHGVQIESYATDNGIHHKISHALVLLTSSLVLEECKASLEDTCEIMIAKRTLNFAHLDKLYSLPEASSLLIVNDLQFHRKTAQLVAGMLDAEIEAIPHFLADDRAGP